MKTLKFLYQSRQALMSTMQEDTSWSERNTRRYTGRPSLLHLNLMVIFAWREFRFLFVITAGMMLTTLFVAASFLLITYEIMVIFLMTLRSIISHKKHDTTRHSLKSDL